MKLAKVTKLVDIVTSTLAALETSLSKVFNNGRVNKCEFTMVQTFQWKLRLELNCYKVY